MSGGGKQDKIGGNPETVISLNSIFSSKPVL